MNEKPSLLDRLEKNKGKAAETTFYVEITETLQMTVEVRAKSPEEAEDLVRAAYDREDYVLSAEHHTGTDFTVLEPREHFHSHDRGGIEQ